MYNKVYIAYHNICTIDETTLTFYYSIQQYRLLDCKMSSFLLLQSLSKVIYYIKDYLTYHITIQQHTNIALTFFMTKSWGKAFD